MSELLKLRNYQRECIDAITGAFNSNKMRVASVLPTGSGKTVIFAHMSEEFLTRNPTQRVLVLVHTDELVQQAQAKMRSVAPHRRIGIVKAAQNETHAQIIVGSVQTLRNAKRRAQINNVGLIIVDECHHATAPSYRAILEHFGALGHDLPNDLCTPADHPKVAGFTATLQRSDKAKLSDVWQDVAFQKSIAYMIRRGYLLDVRGKRVEVPDLNLSAVKVSAGDYQDGALADELDRAFAPEVVAKKYAEIASDRQGIIFAPTVASAQHFADAFNAQGIVTEVVHGALPREERRLILKRLYAGETQCVSNCMVLTEGFDAPCVSCIVVARPTKSAGLYQQMIGRGLRPDLTLPQDERGHALILDVVGVSEIHGLQTLIDLSTRRVPDEYANDLSLLEMEDWEEATADPISLGLAENMQEELYRGEVEVVDFDPLARDSERAWGKTSGGIYYLSIATSGYVFLVESLRGEPGTYDVVWCGPKHTDAAAMTEHTGLSFEMALGWGEDEATERGGHGTLTLTRKKSAWRKQSPSEAQLRMARFKGIVVPMNPDGTCGWSKGQLSEAIDQAMASRRIDMLVRLVKGAGA
jgi:superfamily II DNA or RNA helicase